MKPHLLRFALGIMLLLLLAACASAPDAPTPTETPDNLVIATDPPVVTPSPTRTNTPVPPTEEISPTFTITSTATEAVSEALILEQHLYALGFVEVGLVDGIIDDQTTLAIAHFQWLNQLPITGEISPELMRTLEQDNPVTPLVPPPFPARTLAHYLPSGIEINFLSARLDGLGYLDPGDPAFDPFDFNTLTQAAVQDFQRAHGLNPNGMVDYPTWNQIFSPLAINASGETRFLPADEWDWSTVLFPLLKDPIDLAFDGQFLWVLHSSGESAFDNQLLRINPQAGLLNQGTPITIGKTDMPDWEMPPNSEVSAMLFDGNRLWFLIPRSDGPPQIISLIPGSAEKFLHQTFADQLEGGFPGRALGFDGNRIWATDDNRAWAINRQTGRTTHSFEVGWVTRGKMTFDGRCMWMAGQSGLATFHTGGNYPCPGDIHAYSMPSDDVAFDGQRIWSTGERWDSVYWLDIDAGVMGVPVTVGGAPSALTYDGSILWVSNRGDNTVQGIDPTTGSLGPVIPTGRQPSAILREGDNLWVINAGDLTLQRINVADYQIEIIQPTVTPTPTITLTPTLTITPTLPPLTRNLQLTSPQMTGDDVRLLQNQLIDLGYEQIGVADGIFGPLTDEGVRLFQTINDLTVDGIVGPITWGVLFSGEALGP